MNTKNSPPKIDTIPYKTPLDTKKREKSLLIV